MTTTALPVLPHEVYIRPIQAADVLAGDLSAVPEWAHRSVEHTVTEQPGSLEYHLKHVAEIDAAKRYCDENPYSGVLPNGDIWIDTGTGGYVMRKREADVRLALCDMPDEERRKLAEWLAAMADEDAVTAMIHALIDADMDVLEEGIQAVNGNGLG